MLAHAVSDEKCADASCLETLADLAQEGGHIETKILADVACDKKAIRSRYMAEGIEVARTSGAFGWTNASPVSWRNTRSCLHVKGARRASFWKALIGYGRRRKVERTFSDLKRLPETFLGIGRMERMSRVRSGRPPCAKRVRGNQNEIRTVMQGVVEHGFQGQGLSNPSSTPWDIRCSGGGFCPVLGPAWMPTSDLEKYVEFGSKRMFKVPIHVRLRCFALWGSRAF